MLLFDANLSYRLVKALENVYPNSLHVSRTGLAIPASDTAIWEWAKNNNGTILTNDEDFLHLLEQKGFPPKIILLRIGNQRTSHLTDILSQYQTSIEDFITSQELGLLEIWQGM